jgi:hypothetical protein
VVYTITGSTALGQVVVAKPVATAALVLWRQFNSAGLHPIMAKGHHGENITMEQLIALAELEDRDAPWT